MPTVSPTDRIFILAGARVSAKNEFSKPLGNRLEGIRIFN
jgi:hypothetical protein